MITESLDARLARVLPGTTVRERRDAPPHRRWLVERPAKDGAIILADGGSKREAIDRACFLWGAQR